MKSELSDNILKLLGSPVIIVELSNTQLELIIELSKNEAKSLCQIYECPKLFEFVKYKLYLINARKTWISNISKYDVSGLNISFIYSILKNDEDNLYNILREFKKF